MGGIVHQPMFLVCTDRTDLLRLKCSNRLKIVARKNQEKQLKENQMKKLRQLKVTKLKHLSHLWNFAFGTFGEWPNLFFLRAIQKGLGMGCLQKVMSLQKIGMVFRKDHAHALAPCSIGPGDIKNIFSWIISATKETLNLNIFLWNSFIYGTCCLFCIVCSWKETLLKGKDVKITELIISWLCELWTWIFLHHIDYKMGFLVDLSEERFVTFWTVIWEGRRG